ncbi:MAG TPA: hypothetical protein VK633_15215, partial [Verrucomicrobiae bacterium]|nr:hypothetical protein [Verrucomicrobiae bacterium]
LTVAGTPTSSSRWLSGTKTVTVSDGRLTVNNGSGANNNKLCFIEITPLSGALAARSVSAPSFRLGEIARITSLQLDAGRFTLRIDGVAGSECQIEASDDLRNWTTVPAEANPDGTVSIAVGTPQSGAHQFYRAVLKE